MQVNLDNSFRVRELQVLFKPTRFKSPATIGSPQDVLSFLRPMLKNQPRERLISIALHSGNQVVGFEIVSQGTANTSLAYASEVFKAVLLTNSTAFILAHNHPSGNCEPSLEDRQIAERISKAAELIGIKLLDFLIVTEDSFYSFAQSEPSILNKGGES
jgi:DNA repair protein RadC